MSGKENLRGCKGGPAEMREKYYINSRGDRINLDRWPYRIKNINLQDGNGITMQLIWAISAERSKGYSGM